MPQVEDKDLTISFWLLPSFVAVKDVASIITLLFAPCPSLAPDPPHGMNNC